MESEVGFGVDDLTIDKLKEMQKSLEVGYAYGSTDQTGFGATRIESLDKTMKMAVASEESIRFFKAIKKSKAMSTVEEYTKMNEVGQANFYVEGGSPEEYDEDISRELEKVKYIGALGKVPITATMVKSVIDNEAMIVKAKTLAILKEINYKVFFGDSSLIGVEFNGIQKQFLDRVKYKTQNVIDLRGKYMTPEILSNGAMVIQDNYGNPSNLKFWGSPKSFQDYAKGLIKSRTYMVGNNKINDITVVPKKFNIAEGEGLYETDLFLRQRGQQYHDRPHPKLNSAGNAFVATTAKAPATLDSSHCTATPASDATSLLVAGTYDYAFLPRNKYGVGVPFEIKNVTVTTGQKVNFVISDNSSTVGQEATAFEIYRKLSSATAITEYRYLTSFKTSDTKVDNGEFIPGTTTGFLFDWNFDQVFEYRELLSMVKMPLAQIDDSKRWMQKHYGTPIVFNPNRIVMVKNIGETAWE